MTDFKRLRGLCALVEDVVRHGTEGVERVHLAIAARPFDLLEHTPLAAPARGVRVVHDVAVGAVYASIRGVSHAVGVVAEIAIDVAEESSEHDAPKS